MNLNRDQFAEGLPEGFDEPTALPETSAEAQAWQEANRSWWQRHPMRYDWAQTSRLEPGTREFFQELDRRFLSAASTFLPPRRRPFDVLIPYEDLPRMDVLEIGTGSGTHASLLAEHARSFTGIDLTSEAIDITQARFDAFGLRGNLLVMDAERLDFPDESFDFVWSWGVVHHSSNTGAILMEIRRVLRPGGSAVCMVYNRSLWGYYMIAGFIRGVLMGDLLKTRSLHRTVQRTTDGAMARYYTGTEWRQLATAQGLRVESVQVYGDKSELVLLPGGRLKTRILRILPDGIARLFLHRLRQGSFLVSRLSR